MSSMSSKSKHKWNVNYTSIIINNMKLKNQWISGTFKAKYHGVYQFSVSIQFEGHSTYEFELVRGGRSGATQVLALGKSKNSEFGFQKASPNRLFSWFSVVLVCWNYENQFRIITHTKYQSLSMRYAGQMTQLTDINNAQFINAPTKKSEFGPSLSVNRT